MLIIGAGNLGLHVLDMLIDEKYKSEIVFFDERKNSQNSIAWQYKIINTLEAAKEYFSNTSPDFIAAIGNNRTRHKFVEQFEKIGGNLSSMISSRACISRLLSIDREVIIQPLVSVAHNVSFGKGCVIHANSVIGHDVKLGDYVSVATLTTLIGPCEIGDYAYIGTHCTIMPNIRIGKNAIIAAGSIVDRNMADFEDFINR
jgi:sugar O-acyltransferase (sialic acid O-acetyltransferase NeuD family)